MRKAIVFLLFCLCAFAVRGDYTGRYEQNDGNVVLVTEQDGVLIVRPLFWRATQELVPDGKDRFYSRYRPERKAVFTRDAEGRVVSLTMNGLGHDAPMMRLTHDRPVPAELLMNGKPREAARALRARKDAVEIAIAWGEFLQRALPSKFADGATFLGEFVKEHPDHARLQTTHGLLLVAAGRRAEAKKAFEPAKAETELRMLDAGGAAASAAGTRATSSAPEAGAAPQGPDLDALFAKPTRAEIDAVAAAWAKRDLSPHQVQIISRGKMNLGTTEAEVRIVSHRVHGSLHYGAVIVPNGAKGAPVIVEAKGVSPSYFPLDLSRTPASVELLGEQQKNFIYVLPAYRGEVLQFNGESWTSQGDRTDVWDGATDDFIAFTAAALRVTPEADGERVCAFGRSRGGSVALLAGIRDRMFDCVVAWAGPTDHFFEMIQSGWTPRERAAEGLRVKSDVFGIGGQFIETFLAKPRSVAEQRLHLIASSPLWHAEKLPPAQAHYGVDDNIVSVGNGRALKKRNPRVELVLHDEAGHDLDKEKAWRETKRFLLQRLMPR
ncbi:MAG TPA: prolyl oligopeptidase family serine peptidase [Thermoanaerobaculia bacterium]|nr:prolyl oligopeptidase family serine peptidase [Thermoanaerobaculia bacterium]